MRRYHDCHRRSLAMPPSKWVPSLSCGWSPNTASSLASAGVAVNPGRSAPASGGKFSSAGCGGSAVGGATHGGSATGVLLLVLVCVAPPPVWPVAVPKSAGLSPAGSACGLWSTPVSCSARVGCCARGGSGDGWLRSVGSSPPEGCDGVKTEVASKKLSSSDSSSCVG